MSSPSPTPPGWYPDPDDRTGATRRWFDGSAWTDHRAPAAGLAPPPAYSPQPAAAPRPPSFSSSGRTAALVVGGILTVLFVLGAVIVVANTDTTDSDPASTADGTRATRAGRSGVTAASSRRFPAEPLTVDVCSLLTREELRAVARQDLGEPDRQDPAPGEANPIKRCRYESEDRIEVSLSRYFFTDTAAEFNSFYEPGEPDAKGEPTRYPVEPIDGLPTGSARDPQDFLNLDVAVLTPSGWTLDVHIARHDLPPNRAMVGELRRLTALALDRYAPRQ